MQPGVLTMDWGDVREFPGSGNAVLVVRESVVAVEFHKHYLDGSTKGLPWRIRLHLRGGHSLLVFTSYDEPEAREAYVSIRDWLARITRGEPVTLTSEEGPRT
jgi:hypothetical protein